MVSENNKEVTKFRKKSLQPRFHNTGCNPGHNRRLPHFSEWPGFVINTVAMTFPIMRKTVAEPVVFVSKIT